MTKQVGIWIDHKKAVIIKLDGKREHIEEVLSNVDSRERVEGESDNKSRLFFQSIFPDKKMSNRKEEQLKKFYDRVIEKVKFYESILIFGPSSAKQELKEKIENRNDLQVNGVTTEPISKITRNQMVARVRDFFSVSSV